jgi:hypothetical protein
MDKWREFEGKKISLDIKWKLFGLWGEEQECLLNTRLKGKGGKN